MTDAVELVNEYAAEHLIIACSNANDIADQIGHDLGDDDILSEQFICGDI